MINWFYNCFNTLWVWLRIRRTEKHCFYLMICDKHQNQLYSIQHSTSNIHRNQNEEKRCFVLDERKMISAHLAVHARRVWKLKVFSLELICLSVILNFYKYAFTKNVHCTQFQVSLFMTDIAYCVLMVK